MTLSAGRSTIDKVAEQRRWVTSVGLLDESETVRRYRHILRAASQDWAETAHRHALLRLGPDGRRSVLAEVRRLLVTATRLSQDDVHAIARLLVMAERRAPRVLLDGMPPGLLERLAAAVVDSPVGRMLRAGYDVWDGAEPPRPPEPSLPEDEHRRWLTFDGALWEYSSGF